MKTDSLLGQFTTVPQARKLKIQPFVCQQLALERSVSIGGRLTSFLQTTI
jgi:hypothetical protein